MEELFKQEEIEDVRIIIKAKGKNWALIPNNENAEKEDVDPKSLRIAMLSAILKVHDVVSPAIEDISRKNLGLNISDDGKRSLQGMEWQFKQLGFDEEIWYDKNDPKSKEEDTKYCSYKLKVTDECTLIATFGYDRKGLEWECFETNSEIQIGNEYLELPFDNVYKFRDMYKLITGKRLLGQAT
jgi:hypothetical protein